MRTIVIIQAFISILICRVHAFISCVCIGGNHAYIRTQHIHTYIHTQVHTEVMIIHILALILILICHVRVYV
jgi:hypothetical protein